MGVESVGGRDRRKENGTQHANEAKNRNGVRSYSGRYSSSGMLGGFTQFAVAACFLTVIQAYSSAATRGRRPAAARAVLPRGTNRAAGVHR